MPSNPRESAVFQLVRSNHEQAEQGHKRLREDYREIEERLVKVENLIGEHTYTIGALKTASPDLSRMTLTPGIVVGIITAVVSIVAGQVASTWGIRSDVRDITTKMSLQADAEASRQKLQDERSATLNAKTDGIDKKQEMLRIQVDDLRKEFDRRFQKPR